MRGITRGDVALAASFVSAAVAEAVVVHHGTAGLVLLGICGAPLLAVLAVRRRQPLLSLGTIAAFGVLGTVIQAILWPAADDSGGVWIFALIVACYALGAHARARAIGAGVLLPLIVVLATDLPTMRGWALVNGVLFVTLFVGGLPTLVGRLVRVRRDRLKTLEGQRSRILAEQLAQCESAALKERVRSTERIRPMLADGMRNLADSVECGADPAYVESSARALLSRIRTEVVALAAPLDPASTELALPATDHVQALRAAAQPWIVLGAGAIATGLALESTRSGHPNPPDTAAVAAGLAIGAVLALVWWRPVAAVTVAWCGMALFAHLLAPVDGTLSDAAFALSSAFVVGALSRRRAALLGLGVCLVSRFAVSGTGDPLGETSVMVVAWLGGLALNEVSHLVEQSRDYNALLAGQEDRVAERAVVEERLRLARELHDQVGHTLTVVALQAGAARRLTTSDPQRAQELMRTTIATAAHGGVSVLDPAHSSPDLQAVVEQTRAAGLDVAVRVEGLSELDPDHRDDISRVVQEGLTNVLRHAPGSRASVTVRRGIDDIVVRVSNSPSSGAGDGPGIGRGLAGICERVSARSGRVTWGPRPDGGFELCAVLPHDNPEGVAP